MTLSVVGETSSGSRPLLASDWHTQLNQKQLLAYIRHAFIWHQHGTTDLESPEQSRHVTRWDGGEDSFGCKFTPVWPRIAKMVAASNADPGAWVAAHFSPIGLAKQVSMHNESSFEVRDLSPSSLCSKVSERIYSEYCIYLPAKLRQDFETAGRSINLRLKSLSKLRLSKPDQYLCAVCDEGYVTATPFYRHAFATLFQADEAADKYLWPAAFEYEANQRLYVDVPSWADWAVTDKLLEAVEVIRTHWRRAV